MSSWQILVIGVVGVAVLFIVLGWVAFGGLIVAGLMLAAVVTGFCFRPDRDAWRVSLTTYSFREGAGFTVDVDASKDVIAFRGFIVRLWLLFVPTCIAVAWLVIVSALGIWGPVDFHFDALSSSYWVFMALRFVIAAIAAILSTWLYERWLLNRADACQIKRGSARPSSSGLGFSYYFTVDGEYYGGHDMPMSARRESRQLAQIVLYRRTNPDQSRRVPAFIFHQFDIVGRGVEDLENARAKGADLQRIHWAAQE
jgi:hypothetical protein